MIFYFKYLALFGSSIGVSMKFRETNIKRALKNIFYPKRDDVVVLEPHLGLGDGLICLGLVRELCSREPDVKFIYACLHRCYHTLSWMFRDFDNLYLLAVESGREARQYAHFLNAQYRAIGINNVDLTRWDEFFYSQHQVPFDYRWTKSQVPAGPLSEDLYHQLNPDGEPYILVCEDDSGLSELQLRINNPEQKKIIKVYAATQNLYDWVKMARLADEIHTIDTSFLHFIESIFFDVKIEKPFYYHLARASRFSTPVEFTRRLPWKIVHY